MSKCLLPMGRMLSSSKGAYMWDHPENYVVFNANLCTPDGVRLWRGDLDLTKDEDVLAAWAEELGHELYVLWEHDAFWTEAGPFDIRKAAASVSTQGVKVF